MLGLLFLLSLVSAQTSVYLSSVSPTVQLSYYIDPSNTYISINVTVNQLSWVGLGVSDYTGAMAAPTDAFICIPGSSSNSIARYQITQSSLSGINLIANDNTLSKFCTQTNSQTVMGFTRPLAAIASTDRAMYATGNNDLIFALGSGNSFQEHPQDSAHRSYLLVNFATGTVTPGLNNNAVWMLAHGSFMLLGWGVLMAPGSLIPRYFRHLPNNRWFPLHRIFQGVGFLFSCIGFFIAVGGLSGEGWTNVSAHRAFGLFIFLISLTQPLNAVLRPHPPQKGESKTVKRRRWEMLHHWLGRILIFFGLINIILGIQSLSAGTQQQGFTAVYVIIVIALVIYIAVNEYCRRKRGHIEVKIENVSYHEHRPASPELDVDETR